MFVALGAFGNYARMSGSFCQRADIIVIHSFEEMATIPITFYSAVHGLMNLAHLPAQGEAV